MNAIALAGHDVFMCESTGGGWGNPHQRPANDVLEGVLDEYISIESSKLRYGVVIDPATLKIDVVATAALRAR
ncbi:hypothetical protein [Pseudomonas citronellolis]|nr:hypothetical protein [Pseudomonas citronellolis]WRT82176.1 hypothetical protein VK748_27665 [Pseudomonas citronellolis]